MKEARVLGRGTGNASVVRVLATPVIWCTAVEGSDGACDSEDDGVGSSAPGGAGIL